MGFNFWLKRKKGKGSYTKNPKFHGIRDFIIYAHSINPRITIPKIEGRIHTLLVSPNWFLPSFSQNKYKSFPIYNLLSSFFFFFFSTHIFHNYVFIYFFHFFFSFLEEHIWLGHKTTLTIINWTPPHLVS